MAKSARPVTPKPKRTAGRPHAADAPDARKAIVTAARRLLVDHIPAQVTNSMIAREAGADPALIRYYFGDRASLLMAVVDELLESVREPLRDPAASADQRLRQRIGATLRLSRTTRSMQRIMIDELAESQSAEIRAEVCRWNGSAVTRLAELLASPAGAAIVDVDPLFLHVAILGVCEFFTSAQSIVRPLADPDVDSATLAARYEAFVCDLFLNGLRQR